MKTLKPNAERAKYAIMLIWIVLAVEIIACISNYFQVGLLQTALNGEFISDTDANSNDTRQQLIAILFLIVYVISAITFIQWFRRAYYNLHILVKGLLNTEGWAAGAWFVPIVSLFKPYQIMTEMSQKSKELISKNNSTSESINTSSSTIGFWWALWIINNILGQISFRLPMNTIEEMIVSTNIDVYSILLQVPLAIITVKIIKEHSSLEALLVNLPTEDNSKIEEFVITKQEI